MSFQNQYIDISNTQFAFLKFFISFNSIKTFKINMSLNSIKPEKAFNASLTFFITIFNSFLIN